MSADSSAIRYVVCMGVRHGLLHCPAPESADKKTIEEAKKYAARGGYTHIACKDGSKVTSILEVGEC